MSSYYISMDLCPTIRRDCRLEKRGCGMQIIAWVRGFAKYDGAAMMSRTNTTSYLGEHVIM
jgi:hypothetical protein